MLHSCVCYISQWEQRGLWVLHVLRVLVFSSGLNREWASGTVRLRPSIKLWGLIEHVLHMVLRGWQHTEPLPSLFHHWHKKPSAAGSHQLQKTLSRRHFHKALKSSAWREKTPLYKVTCDKKLRQTSSQAREHESVKIFRENSAFYWLTNTFSCQTRPEAERQVCFQGGR